MRPVQKIRGPSSYLILWMASIRTLFRLLRHLFSKHKHSDIPFVSTFLSKSRPRCKVPGSSAGVMMDWSVYLINVPAISSGICSMVTVCTTSYISFLWLITSNYLSRNNGPKRCSKLQKNINDIVLTSTSQAHSDSAGCLIVSGSSDDKLPEIKVWTYTAVSSVMVS
jgi:hypothetical protein